MRFIDCQGPTVRLKSRASGERTILLTYILTSNLRPSTPVRWPPIADPQLYIPTTVLRPAHSSMYGPTIMNLHQCPPRYSYQLTIPTYYLRPLPHTTLPAAQLKILPTANQPLESRRHDPRPLLLPPPPIPSDQREQWDRAGRLAGGRERPLLVMVRR